MNKKFVIDIKKSIYFMKTDSSSFNTTKKILLRDLNKVFNYNFTESKSKEEADIIIDKNSRYTFNEEEFKIFFEVDKNIKMKLEASDDLGFIYGMLYISEKFLKVDPFWFWSDREPKKSERIEIDIKEYKSVKHFVKYRGWFVNDEVCLIGWTDIYPPPKEVWFPVFETLLRLGGNMVIPGTDLPRTGIHWELASNMGFYITHHHAEPLGAEMFARAYPHLEANYNTYKNEFEKLWRIAINKQRNKKIIWTLGFRGQGDCPFWENDSNIYTEPEKGKIISNVIKRQYDILCEYQENPICCVYLYGEIMELYQLKYIKFPNGVIKIWSDNGYGKMVSRRTGNSNYRIKSLPDNNLEKNGMYYHITFHDLQASNHLTMLQNQPSFIRDEIVNSYNDGVREYLLLNSGNIRPHIFYLGYLSELWIKGDCDPELYFDKFINNYFSGRKNVKKCYEDFMKSGIKYGENIDDVGGDEFFHHPVRILIGYWIRGEFKVAKNKLFWLSGKNVLDEQVEDIYKLLNEAKSKFKKLENLCSEALLDLNEEEGKFFKDNLLFQVRLLHYSCKGFNLICEGFYEYRKNRFPHSFIKVSEALWEYKKCLDVFKESEIGKWKNFYRSDWLTNVKSTIYTIDTLRKFIRIHGDSPDLFLWYREYILSDTEKRIYLENTQRKPLSDDELAIKLMKVL